jgi:hypothetical protein
MRNIVQGSLFLPLRPPPVVAKDPPTIDLSRCYHDNQQPCLVETVKLSNGVSIYDKGFVVDGDPFKLPKNHHKRYQTPEPSQLHFVQEQQEKEMEVDVIDESDPYWVPVEIRKAWNQREIPRKARQVDDEYMLMTKSPTWGRPYKGSASCPILPSLEKRSRRELTGTTFAHDVATNTLTSDTRGSKARRQRVNVDVLLKKKEPVAIEIIKSEIEAITKLPGSNYGASSHASSHPYLSSSSSVLPASGGLDPVRRTNKYLKHLPTREIAANLLNQIQVEAIKASQEKYPDIPFSSLVMGNEGTRRNLNSLTKKRHKTIGKYLTVQGKDAVDVDDKLLEMYLPMCSPSRTQ